MRPVFAWTLNEHDNARRDASWGAYRLSVTYGLSELGGPGAPAYLWAVCDDDGFPLQTGHAHELLLARRCAENAALAVWYAAYGFELDRWVEALAVLQAAESICKSDDEGWFGSPYVDWPAAELLAELGRWERHPTRENVYRPLDREYAASGGGGC